MLSVLVFIFDIHIVTAALNGGARNLEKIVHEEIIAAASRVFTGQQPGRMILVVIAVARQLVDR